MEPLPAGEDRWPGTGTEGQGLSPGAKGKWWEMTCSWGLWEGEKEEARWDRKDLSEKQEETSHPPRAPWAGARMVGGRSGEDLSHHKR